MSAYYYAIVLVAMASLSISSGAVLPYSSSAMVKSERNGDNFAYSISQNQQSIGPIARAFPLTAQMPVMTAGSAGYPIHGGVLPVGSHHQTLNYAAQPSLLMPQQHPMAAPALAYNPHLYMTQHQSHVPLPHAPQYLH